MPNLNTSLIKGGFEHQLNSAVPLSVIMSDNKVFQKIGASYLSFVGTTARRICQTDDTSTIV